MRKTPETMRVDYMMKLAAARQEAERTLNVMRQLNDCGLDGMLADE